jgi:hypothetical protein
MPVPMMLVLIPPRVQHLDFGNHLQVTATHCRRRAEEVPDGGRTGGGACPALGRTERRVVREHRGMKVQGLDQRRHALVVAGVPVAVPIVVVVIVVRVGNGERIALEGMKPVMGTLIVVDFIAGMVVVPVVTPVMAVPAVMIPVPHLEMADAGAIVPVTVAVAPQVMPHASEKVAEGAIDAEMGGDQRTCCKYSEALYNEIIIAN